MLMDAECIHTWKKSLTAFYNHVRNMKCVEEWKRYKHKYKDIYVYREGVRVRERETKTETDRDRERERERDREREGYWMSEIVI